MDRRWFCARSQLHWCGALAEWIALTEWTVSKEGDPPLLTCRVSWGLWFLSGPTFQLWQMLNQFCTEQKRIVHGSATSGQPGEPVISLKLVFCVKKKSLLFAHLSQNPDSLLHIFSGSQEMKRDGLFKNPLPVPQQNSRATNPGLFLFDISQWFAYVSPHLR